MIDNEELLTDNHFALLNGNQQSDILRNHCTEIEDLIRTASSRLEAERAAADTCIKFQHECSSALVRHALIHRAEEFLSKHWNNRTA
ncbi:MAG: hypothetical protein EHM64_07190 [Ignavibacteriae bacterium]|nr:MAG: hypothetical protein EHM64_07190 [Ignavibacteriota bacterium]